MRPGGKSNGESPCFETPNLSFEGRVRNIAPLKRDVIDPAPVAHVTAPYTTLDRVGGCEAAAS